MINTHKTPKSKALSLSQMKQVVEEENKLHPLELVSSPTNRKALERRKRADHIEQLYQQVCTEVAAKMNLQREEQKAVTTWTS